MEYDNNHFIIASRAYSLQVSVQLRSFLLLTICNGDNLMHPPTYMCTHISVHKTIIEDNKLVWNQSTKYFTIAKNNHYPNLDTDTINHGKTIDCTTNHVCQEIIVGGQDGVVVDDDDDDEHAGGGGANRRRFWQRSPPPNFSGDSLLSLCLCVFDLHRYRPSGTPRGPFL
jgi:hypothetical protein